MSEEEKIRQSGDNQQSTEESKSVEQQKIEQSEFPPISGTIEYKPQTEEMEVHHHPHVAKKNFKEYFLEFLMIFLAVTMGFFAENIREHLSDNAKEKEYVGSLVADLEIDQKILSENISELQTGISMMDSMVTILDRPSQIKNNTGELYFLARLSPRLQPLSINDKTFEQLKNSGNFRLIKNINTSNKIMNYYQKIPLVRLLESINETEFTQYKIVAAKIFNPEIFLSTEGKANEISRVSGNPPLRTTDNELLQELSIFTVYMHGTKKGILGADVVIKQSGADLIEFLKKEYHLKNE